MNDRVIQPGSLVEGHRAAYAVAQLAGEGGVGSVYKARRVDTGVLVAIKVLHSKRFSHTDVQVARFRQEIEAAVGDVNSPYIVKGVDFGQYGDEPFLVLEWMAGGTLQDVVAARDYDEPWVIRTMARLLKATRYLHGKGYVHRDIKPNNVFLDEDRGVKLGDLGVMKSGIVPQHLTASEHQIGSLLYISERQRAHPATCTARDDFFSLCHVLYELITGRRIHTRNPSLAYLRPQYLPTHLWYLIDLGMADREDWEQIYNEMCQCIDLDAETLARDYTGSLYVPSVLVSHFRDVIMRRIPERRRPDPPAADSELRERVIEVLVGAFRECNNEMAAAGVSVGIDDTLVAEDALGLGASFDDDIESHLATLGIDESVYEGLYGWVCVELVTGDAGGSGVRIAGVGGKRLYADTKYFPPDFAERVITSMDSGSVEFVRSCGRALAVGVALGALERISEVWEQKLDEAG